MFLNPEILEKIKLLSEPGMPIYLVGGAVRDSVLGVESRDLDFVCTANTRSVARKFADAMKGNFYAMDEQRKIFRVIATGEGLQTRYFDFTEIRGQSIEEDLAHRDFTINSMAVNLARPASIIDPLKGGRDLQQKWLRLSSASSLEEDPVRVIRAARYAVGLNLKIDHSTMQQISQHLPFLARVSPERKRDEVFKILELQRPAVAFRLMQQLGILGELRLDVGTAFISAARRMENTSRFIDALCGHPTDIDAGNFLTAALLLRLGRFKDHLASHWMTPNSSGRDLRSLNLLACYFHGQASAYIESALSGFALSTDEGDFVKLLCATPSGEKKISDDALLSPGNAYRFFREYGASGIDFILMELADYASRIPAEFSQDHWLHLLEVAEYLVQVWFERPEISRPKPFLSGDDLILQFHLTPGPEIGVLLEGLKEAQASGKILNRAQALDWAGQQIAAGK